MSGRERVKEFIERELAEAKRYSDMSHEDRWGRILHLFADETGWIAADCRELVRQLVEDQPDSEAFKRLRVENINLRKYSNEQNDELVKLRAEVTRLRGEAQAMSKQLDEALTAGETIAEAAKHHKAESSAALDARDAWRERYDNLKALVDSAADCSDFIRDLQLEAAHQVERWGVEHDAGKRPEDWFTLLQYLLGKAAKAHFDGDREKLLHHIVTGAAVLFNWWRRMMGVEVTMRPGVAEEGGIAWGPMYAYVPVQQREGIDPIGSFRLDGTSWDVYERLDGQLYVLGKVENGMCELPDAAKGEALVRVWAALLRGPVPNACIETLHARAGERKMATVPAMPAAVAIGSATEGDGATSFKVEGGLRPCGMCGMPVSRAAAREHRSPCGLMCAVTEGWPGRVHDRNCPCLEIKGAEQVRTFVCVAPSSTGRVYEAWRVYRKPDGSLLFRTFAGPYDEPAKGYASQLAEAYGAALAAAGAQAPVQIGTLSVEQLEDLRAALEAPRCTVHGGHLLNGRCPLCPIITRAG